MSDYQVPPDRPDYRVASAISQTDACPKCGSHAAEVEKVEKAKPKPPRPRKG